MSVPHNMDGATVLQQDRTLTKGWTDGVLRLGVQDALAAKVEEMTKQIEELNKKVRLRERRVGI